MISCHDCVFLIPQLNRIFSLSLYFFSKQHFIKSWRYTRVTRERTCTCCEAGSRDRWDRSNASHSLIGPHSARRLQRELLLFWSPKLNWTELLASLVHITRLLIGPPRTPSSVQSLSFSGGRLFLSHGYGSCGKNPLCWDLQILNGPESRLKEWLPTHIYSHHPTEASLYIVRRPTKSWLFCCFPVGWWISLLCQIISVYVGSLCWLNEFSGASLFLRGAFHGLCLCHPSLCSVITACQWQ